MQGENKEGKLLFFFKKFQTTSISHYRMMKKTNENSYLSQFMTRYSKACTKMKCTVCYSFIYSLYLTTFRLNLQGYFNEISLNWEHFPTKQERSGEQGNFVGTFERIFLGNRESIVLLAFGSVWNCFLISDNCSSDQKGATLSII